MAPVECTSSTVTEQVEEAPTDTDDGLQLTVVAVLRFSTSDPVPDWGAPMLLPPLVGPLAVTVKEVVPGVDAALVVTVSVTFTEFGEPPNAIELGENEPAAPDGKPEMEKPVTLQLPPVFVTVTA